MAAPDAEPATLGALLAEAPERLPLRQMLRLLRRLHGTAGEPLAAPLPVRLRGSRGLAQPATEVERYRPAGLGPLDRPEVVTPINALGGAAGALPNPDRAAIADAAAEEPDEDGRLAALADLLWQRMAELDQAAWERPLFALREERGDPGGLDLALRSLIAEPAGGLPGLPGVDLRAFADRLNPMIRNHLGLQEVLAEMLGVPVAVEPLQGCWTAVPLDSRACLGGAGEGTGLGEGLVLGRLCHDRAASVMVRVGPVDAGLGGALLEVEPPGRTALMRGIGEFCELLLHGHADARVVVDLADAAVPALVLGVKDVVLNARLGLTAVLGGAPSG